MLTDKLAPSLALGLLVYPPFLTNIDIARLAAFMVLYGLVP
jgi:hypothetical protein